MHHRCSNLRMNLELWGVSCGTICVFPDESRFCRQLVCAESRFMESTSYFKNLFRFFPVSLFQLASVRMVLLFSSCCTGWACKRTGACKLQNQGAQAYRAYSMFGDVWGASVDVHGTGENGRWRLPHSSCRCMALHPCALWGWSCRLLMSMVELLLPTNLVILAWLLGLLAVTILKPQGGSTGWPAGGLFGSWGGASDMNCSSKSDEVAKCQRHVAEMIAQRCCFQVGYLGGERSENQSKQRTLGNYEVLGLLKRP